jgi:hypothetical protein
MSVTSRKSKKAEWSVSFYSAAKSALEIGAEAYLSRFLTTDSGISSSFLVG